MSREKLAAFNESTVELKANDYSLRALQKLAAELGLETVLLKDQPLKDHAALLLDILQLPHASFFQRYTALVLYRQHIEIETRWEVLKELI